MTTSRFLNSKLSLCVYCGSGEGRSASYMQAARDLGSSMAENNVGLVYGGGSIGLMGEVARTVIAGNAEVTGIIPKFLVKRERMLRMATTSWSLLTTCTSAR